MHIKILDVTNESIKIIISNLQRSKGEKQIKNKERERKLYPSKAKTRKEINVSKDINLNQCSQKNPVTIHAACENFFLNKNSQNP